MQVYILREIPGGTHSGQDITLNERQKNVVSVGWGYIPNLNQVPDNEFKDYIFAKESSYNDNKSHLDHVYKTLKMFILEINVGDILLIPQSAKNGHDGTNLHVVKVLSDIKYNPDDPNGCTYYRDAEWCSQIIKWRSAPYNSAKKSDISLELMHFMWKPEIKLKTLTGPHNQFLEEAQILYQDCH
jgi:predicted Mrr-cat superfamily restriction endonuclease